MTLVDWIDYRQDAAHMLPHFGKILEIACFTLVAVLLHFLHAAELGSSSNPVAGRESPYGRRRHHRVLHQVKNSLIRRIHRSSAAKRKNDRWRCDSMALAEVASLNRENTANESYEVPAYSRVIHQTS